MNPDGTQDINLYSFGHEHSTQDVHYTTCGEITIPRWSDTIKITDNINKFSFYADKVFGGKEDVVDINNGADGTCVFINEWHPQGKYVATIKGGSKNTYLWGNVMGHGKEVDIDIGNPVPLQPFWGANQGEGASGAKAHPR